MSREIIQDIIDDFSVEKLVLFFRGKNRSFRTLQEDLSFYNDQYFIKGSKLGEINLSSSETLFVCSFLLNQPLSERSSKKSQYEKAKKILKETQSDAGIFIFYDSKGNFRFSLVYSETFGNRRRWTNFRRFTYFVTNEHGVTNKTFLQRIGQGDFSTLEKIKEAFALGPVTDIFYKDFFAEYSKVVEAVTKSNKIKNYEKARDFVLLFSIRVIFIGFIQKRGWIGNDDRFIQNLFKEYAPKFMGNDQFYKKWLVPLFFQALNSPPGSKVSYGDNDFSKQTEQSLQMAPFLNGGLFKEKPAYDNEGHFIPDKAIKDFFDFLFSYNFTIEENSYEDEDLQVNPEFLGIIFERLVNKADGAVYTPRTEVDFMCRLSLLKWLQKNITHPISSANLYELFFREGEKEEDQKEGSFSNAERDELFSLLEDVTVCDPAVGSGAFLVGMMQVIDEAEDTLKRQSNIKNNSIFERKRKVIAKSLYGVEVKEWAVWICQLRLWLSLFVEAPEDMRQSFHPILPSLDFKVRQGDSLVQRIGSKSFPVLGHAMINESVKRKVTQLKNLKNEYFGNESSMKDWEVRQRELAIYDEILKSEILEKQKKLKQLKNISSKTEPSLFGNEFFKPSQEELVFDKDKIEAIEEEVNELVEQKRNIRQDKPLIWNIEFAEIFVESGGFDIVIGNPPYVRQEYIADPTNKIKDKKEYKGLLQEMVKIDFPVDFPKKTKINAQSDLYTYFYIRALRLLNLNGIHTFICSNSWLDVGYGTWLQKFLLDRTHIELIIDNHAKRSFEAADVNTIITVIHAPVKKIDPTHLIKFVAFKQPFEEAIFTEYLLNIEEAKEIVSNDIFRVYPISIKGLNEAGTKHEEEAKKQKILKIGKYVGDKWGGKYLRAPDIFFTILEKGKDKLVKLGDIAEVRFGIKTGANEFFYLTDTQAKEWKIEKEFLKPVIKSPRECSSILVNPKDLKYKIFICNKSRQELEGTHALQYIKWGEGEKFHKRPSCKGRKYWWSITDLPEYISIPMFYRTRYPIQWGPTPFYALNNQYFVKYEDVASLVAVLLSTFSFISFEQVGRFPGGGGGPLEIMVYESENILILDPRKLPNEQMDNLRKTMSKLSKREIRSIFEECGLDPKAKVAIEKQEPSPLPDRAELDKIVFDALDLTKDERKDVYRAVCRLVWNRINKAKSI
jgi:hypothetical protein